MKIIIIDDKNHIVINQNGNVALDTDSDHKEIKQQAEPKIKKRNYDSFMHDNMQFIKVGDVYAKIALNDEMTTICRSNYYKNRGKVQIDAV